MNYYRIHLNTGETLEYEGTSIQEIGSYTVIGSGYDNEEEFIVSINTSAITYIDKR